MGQNKGWVIALDACDWASLLLCGSAGAGAAGWLLVFSNTDELHSLAGVN